MDQDTEEKCIRGGMDEYVDTEEAKLRETVGLGRGAEGGGVAWARGEWKMCLSKK